MSGVVILPFTFAPVGPNGPDKPRILCDNILQNPDVVLSTDAPPVDGYSYLNAVDMRAYTYWRVGAGTYYLNAVYGEAQDVNAWCFYSGTMAAVGASLQPQFSTDGGMTWEDADTPYFPPDTAPVYRVLDEVISAARWRIKIVTPAEMDIGVISIGKDFTFERGCWVGFSPPHLARDTTITNTTSEGGVFLGRTIRRNGVSFNFNLDKLSIAWVENFWRIFVRNAELEPFFLLWYKTAYPTDACYCWADGDIPQPEFSHSNFMRASMKVKGRVE